MLLNLPINLHRMLFSATRDEPKGFGMMNPDKHLHQFPCYLSHENNRKKFPEPTVPSVQVAEICVSLPSVFAGRTS